MAAGDETSIGFGIELKRSAVTLKKSLLDKVRPIHLHRTASDIYFPLSTDASIDANKPLSGTYAFVILQTPGGLELRAGKGSHVGVSSKAPFVMAAGDLHFENGSLVFFTDQSGSYHIDVNAPFAKEKKATAKAIMEEVGLPMEKFRPFEAKPLLFSNPLRPRTAPKTSADPKKTNTPVPTA